MLPVSHTTFSHLVNIAWLGLCLPLTNTTQECIPISDNQLLTDIQFQFLLKLGSLYQSLPFKQSQTRHTNGPLQILCYQTLHISLLSNSFYISQAQTSWQRSPPKTKDNKTIKAPQSSYLIVTHKPTSLLLGNDQFFLKLKLKYKGTKSEMKIVIVQLTCQSAVSHTLMTSKIISHYSQRCSL